MDNVLLLIGMLIVGIGIGAIFMLYYIMFKLQETDPRSRIGRLAFHTSPVSRKNWEKQPRAQFMPIRQLKLLPNKSEDILKTQRRILGWLSMYPDEAFTLMRLHKITEREIIRSLLPTLMALNYLLSKNLIDVKVIFGLEYFIYVKKGEKNQWMSA